MENLPNPTEAELEILQTLWQTGSCSVKQVHGILQEKREVGYTTILKQLQIMLEKGLVQRATQLIEEAVKKVNEFRDGSWKQYKEQAEKTKMDPFGK